MSGDLEDPKIHTIWNNRGFGCLHYYLLLSFLYSSTNGLVLRRLLDNTTIMIDQSWSPAFMKFVILCATSSSALATLVGGSSDFTSTSEGWIHSKGRFLAILSSDGRTKECHMAYVEHLLYLLCCFGI